MRTLFLAILGTTALGTTMAAAELNTTSPDITTISSGEYVMDKTHGYVLISYSHLGLSNPVLRFDDVDAIVTLNADNPASSTLEVEIDPASINSGIAKFDEHLKNADMFHVEEHPAASFTSTSLDLDAGTLTGDLTIKGITKPVTLDVTLNATGQHPMAGKDVFGISATGEISRSEWDLGYAVQFGVGDAVDLQIEAEFLKAE